MATEAELRETPGGRRVRVDRPGRLDRADQPDRLDRPARADRPDRPAQPVTPTSTPSLDPYASKEYAPTPESLPRIQQGLVSMLDKDNELMKLTRARGMRIGNQRGLGASSFAARAGEGAVMDYITPIVTQAEQFDVQKELQAQTLTGKSFSEAQAHLANKYQQEADVKFQQQAQATDIEAKQQAQEVDIEFQRWAKEADLSHLQLLEGNRSAAIAGQNYSNQLAEIYANPDTTTLQKQEAARLLSEAFTTNLELIEVTSKIDLSKFLPDYIAQQPAPAPAPAPSPAPTYTETYQPGATKPPWMSDDAWY